MARRPTFVTLTFPRELGFPVGMSAGGDDARRAAARVSVIASIGYCAFLAGPPTIGFLGNHITVLRALTIVAVLFGIAAVLSTNVLPLRPTPAALDHAPWTNHGQAYVKQLFIRAVPERTKVG
jgi:hypothetical protein